jgi:hypothetical protein
MVNRNHAIIAFISNPVLSSNIFPSTPDEIIGNGCSINCISYTGCDPRTEVLDANAEEVFIPYYDLKTNSHLVNIIGSVLHMPCMLNRVIYSVHPTAVLLPLYKWYLMKNGMPIDDINNQVNHFSRRTVDICEAFHKPAILTLDRRKNFSHLDIAKWFDINFDKDSDDRLNCLKALKYICHRL